MRVLQRTSIYDQDLKDLVKLRKDSFSQVCSWPDKQTPLVSLLVHFMSSLEARNFFERCHNTWPQDCLDPVYCILISEVYISSSEIHTARPPQLEQMMEEDKRAPTPKQSTFLVDGLQLIKLPNCIGCLMLLDDQVSGISVPGNYKPDTHWKDMQALCITCKTVAQQNPECSKCATTNAVWYAVC